MYLIPWRCEDIAYEEGINIINHVFVMKSFFAQGTFLERKRKVGCYVVCSKLEEFALFPPNLDLANHHHNEIILCTRHFLGGKEESWLRCCFFEV